MLQRLERFNNGKIRHFSTVCVEIEREIFLSLPDLKCCSFPQGPADLRKLSVAPAEHANCRPYRLYNLL